MLRLFIIAAMGLFLIGCSANNEGAVNAVEDKTEQTKAEKLIAQLDGHRKAEFKKFTGHEVDYLKQYPKILKKYVNDLGFADKVHTAKFNVKHFQPKDIGWVYDHADKHFITDEGVNQEVMEAIKKNN